MENSFLARHNQIFEGTRRGRALHAKESSCDSVQIRLIPVVLRHSRRSIHGRGVLQFRLDVGHKIVCNLGHAEFQIGGVFPSKCAQVRSKIFLRIQALHRMAARAPLLQKEAMSKLNFLLSWLPELRNASEQIGIS